MAQPSLRNLQVFEVAARHRSFRAAAEAALKGAKTHPENAFKVELAKRCVTRALKMATA